MQAPVALALIGVNVALLLTALVRGARMVALAGPVMGRK